MLKPQEYRQGIAQKTAKLDDDMVRQIRLERRSGAFIKDIAIKHRVSQSTISQICNRIIWAHVQDIPF